MNYNDKQTGRTWQIRSVELSIDSEGTEEKLLGSVAQYSITTKEPPLPTSVVLTRSSIGKNTTLANRSLTKMEVYPNPFNKELTVQFTLQQAQQVRVTVHSASGAEVYTDYWDCREGMQTQQIYLEVPVGTYTVTLEGEEEKTSVVVIKK